MTRGAGEAGDRVRQRCGRTDAPSVDIDDVGVCRRRALCHESEIDVLERPPVASPTVRRGRRRPESGEHSCPKSLGRGLGRLRQQAEVRGQAAGCGLACHVDRERDSGVRSRELGGAEPRGLAGLAREVGNRNDPAVAKLGELPHLGSAVGPDHDPNRGRRGQLERRRPARAMKVHGARSPLGQLPPRHAWSRTSGGEVVRRSDRADVRDRSGGDVIPIDDDEADTMRVQALGSRRVKARRGRSCELDAPESWRRGGAIHGGRPGAGRNEQIQCNDCGGQEQGPSVAPAAGCGSHASAS